MAVPFTVEEDTDYAQLQQLLTDLWHILQQIQVLQRSRRNADHTLAEDRGVASTSSSLNGRVTRIESGQRSFDLDRRFPESMVNLALSLVSVDTVNDSTTVHLQTSASPTRCRPPRRRTTSEPSPSTSSSSSTSSSTTLPSSSTSTLTLCCDDTKPVKVSVSVEFTNNQKWIQQEDSTESTPNKQSSSCGSESLLSKLVPAPFNGPLWTAVICMVGWHLLRTR